MGSRDHNNNGKLYVVAERVEGGGGHVTYLPLPDDVWKERKSPKFPPTSLL
jgi:hypothetical protein